MPFSKKIFFCSTTNNCLKSAWSCLILVSDLCHSYVTWSGRFQNLKISVSSFGYHIAKRESDTRMIEYNGSPDCTYCYELFGLKSAHDYPTCPLSMFSSILFRICNKLYNHYQSLNFQHWWSYMCKWSIWRENFATVQRIGHLFCLFLLTLIPCLVTPTLRSTYIQA